MQNGRAERDLTQRQGFLLCSAVQSCLDGGNGVVKTAEQRADV